MASRFSVSVSMREPRPAGDSGEWIESLGASAS
jgi:hypothetical protein